MPVVELGGSVFWQRLQDDPAMLAYEICSIDLVDLQTTLQRHAGLRAWVNAAYESARIAEEKAKWALTKLRSKWMVTLSKAKDEVTGKAKTVDILKAEVE